MTALEFFRLLAPEFAGVIDATVNGWLAIAGRRVDVSCLDAEGQAEALALYAAHVLRLTQQQASSANAALGAIASEREGDLARTYSVVKHQDTWLGQTTYGQQFLEVTRPCSGVGIMTRVS